MEHRGRFASFSVIGGGVFLLGLAMQVVLVRDAHLNAIAAFFLQGFVSVQVSFLLNHFWTWRAERVPFWQACWKFNVSKVLTTIANLVLYAGLVRAGMNYVVANVATTAVFTVVNYIVGHYWAFSSKSPAMVPANEEEQALLALDLDVEPQPWWPSVSVVVPCKNNPDTIRATVDALLSQEYPALKEVILVGSTNDTTWTELADINDLRLELLEQSPVEGLRDPGVKRDKGVSKSSGDVIAFADSDIVMEPRWLARGVAALLAQGGGVAAGGMRSIHDTFWGRFVDQNRLGAKTPRLPAPYLVTAENFGRRNRKPPVTANVILTRQVYDDQPIDKAWMYGYEDYEWFWRVAKAGHRILFTDALTGRHHHRRSFRHLVTEYRRAAHGCAMFVRRHPDSPLARKRRQQALLLPLLGLAALAGAGAAVAQGHALAVATAMVAGMAFLMGREFARSRTAESLAYPFAGGALGLVFATRVAQGLALPVRQTPSAAPEWSAPKRRRIAWPLGVILAVQAGLSLGLVWSNTAFGDEANYLWVGHLDFAHWFHGDPVPSYVAGTLSGSPILYPSLGAAAADIGGLAGARILSLIFMLAATTLLYLVVSRLFGRAASLISAGLWGICEPSLRLAFATYDAMSVLFVALAIWLAVQATYRRWRGEFVAATAISLALAMATAYSALVIVPAVICFAFAVWNQRMGLRQAVACTGWLVAAAAIAYAGIMTAGRSWPGLMFTVLARSATVDRSPSPLILEISWRSIGLLVAVAAIGVLVAFGQGDRKCKLILLTALAPDC